MQIVIDIDEEYYELVKHSVVKEGQDFLPYKIIANGTPLPKGHGRLIDADAFINEQACCGYIEDIDVDVFNSVTPTIIEADKESEEV